LLTRDELDRLAAKTDVVRPTLPAGPPIAARAERPAIVYMGRVAREKGANVALEVFRRIDEAYGDRVRLVYVGPVPDDCPASASIEVHPVLDRGAYRDVLACGHIFLSPTEFESYGFGLVEAARFGLAIVTSRGPGMEHVEELFKQDQNALFVSTDDTSRVDAYEASLRTLLDNPDTLARIRLTNLELFRSGPMSIERRDEKLLGYYGRMIVAAHRVKPSPRDVPSRILSLETELGLKSRVLSDRECQHLRSLQDSSARRVLVTAGT
jgi:glycosyltransferase involved in cell wall biosynthesis